jgi:hypothetical protein
MARKTPGNRNLLNPNGFQLLIARMPNVEFFVQDVEIPGLSTEEISQDSPLSIIKHPGDQMIFSPLNIVFALDEDLSSWEELYKWKVGLAFPEDSQQYKKLLDGIALPPDKIYSDLSIIIETNHHNPNLLYKFKDVFPVSISSFVLTARNSDVPPLEFSVSFSYTTFSFERIKK